MTVSDGGLVTIPDVEILKVGNWQSGLSGRVPVTDEDVDAMIAASADAEIDAAPTKPGHVDPRFDGEPALGWLRNLRKRPDGTLVADIADAPAKLETLIRSGFRRRSAEIAWNVRTPSGRTYKAALAGLALLGVTPPAVKGLADVMTRYSAPRSDGVGSVTIVDGDDSELAELEGKALSATAAYEARKAYLAGVDPGSANVDGPHPDHPTNAEPQGGSVNDDQVREALGLPADLPVTDQLRKLADTQAEQAAAAEAAAKAKAEEEAKAKADADRKAAEASAAAAGAVTTIDTAALAQLQAQAAAGADAKRTLDEQERERELAAALSGGKIAPANLDLWRTQWDANKDQTKALLAGLPQVFATVETFSALSGAPVGNAAGAQPAEPAGLDDIDRELRSFMSAGRG